MGYDTAIRRGMAHTGRDQQRTMKPAAILVWSFEIDVSRPFFALQNREIRGAGIKPHIQNVVLFAKLRRTAGTFSPSRQEFFRRMFVPGVRAFLLEPSDDIAKCDVILELFAAALAEEHDDGHTPKALTRDTPVRAFFDHFVDAVFAPAWNPFDVMNLSECFRTQ